MVLCCTIVQGQVVELNTSYYLINDEYSKFIFERNQLVFQNDTILKEIVRNKNKDQQKFFNYMLRNDSIVIFDYYESDESLKLVIDGNRLLNTKSKKIYLTYDMINGKEEFIIVVEGKIWKASTYSNKRKRKKSLRKLFKSRIKDKHKMTSLALSGFDSYMKYGYVNGAFEYWNE